MRPEKLEYLQKKYESKLNPAKNDIPVTQEKKGPRMPGGPGRHGGRGHRGYRKDGGYHPVRQALFKDRRD